MINQKIYYICMRTGEVTHSHREAMEWFRQYRNIALMDIKTHKKRTEWVWDIARKAEVK